MKYQDLQLTLRNLSDVLFMPETFEHGGNINLCLLLLLNISNVNYALYEF